MTRVGRPHKHAIYPLAFVVPTPHLLQPLYNTAHTENTYMAADNAARPRHAVFAVQSAPDLSFFANVLCRAVTGVDAINNCANGFAYTGGAPINCPR